MVLLQHISQAEASAISQMSKIKLAVITQKNKMNKFIKNYQTVDLAGLHCHAHTVVSLCLY